MKITRIFIVLCTISFALSACQAATPFWPSPTPNLPPKATVVSQSETPKLLPTSALSATKPLATLTLTATLLPSITATATLAPTLTPSLTPTPVFAGFRIMYADFQHFGLVLVFNIPGIKVAYDLQVSKVKYECHLQKELPDQLLCYGPDYPNGRKVNLEFFLPNQTSQPVFKTDYVIALVKTPTPEGWIPPGNGDCPVRGISASCETENRPATWPGGPCIVSTCVDICGYWYSIDTCGN